MELPDTLLRPIAGSNPSGQNLRYDAIYEKVKEARREEEDLPQGQWSYAVKTADPALVVKLTTEALSNKSKDLQLAAWLTEALLRKEGIGGLKKGLDLVRQLIESFWGSLYPVAEDGDIELRAAPLNWLGSYLGGQVKKTQLTQSEYNWFQYVESRAVGYEKDCDGNDAKTAARQAAIAEKKLTAEEFDADMNATEPAFYTQLVGDLEGALASLQALDDLCNEKLGRDSPSFSKLREALDDVRLLANSFAESKGPAAATEEPEEANAHDSAPARTGAPPAARGGPAKPTVSEEPADRDDAIHRIVAVARYLRKAEPYSPAAYMILRGLRWGELRAAGSSGFAELEAPPSAIRQNLKRLLVEGQWSDLLEAAEDSMAMPCGKAWLDLQRYTVRACQEMGGDYAAMESAVRAGVKGLVADFPEITRAVFLDDTPVANSDTLAWLEEIAGASQNATEVPEPVPAAPVPAVSEFSNGEPDIEVLAAQTARAGRLQEAMEMLSKEIAQVRSGRARFQRKTQLANLCLSTGHEAIAYPILKELAEEIENRKLDEWEAPAMLANSLTLLFQCLQKMGNNSEEKEMIYQRICRLDPVRALISLKHR